MGICNNVLFSCSFSFETLKLNYLAISKAAGFCSAHFTGVLYAELWCRERLSSLEEANPQNENSVESGYNLLDLIYENVGDQVGLTLQNILQSAYQAIGDLDALSGCGLTFLLQPEYRADYYKNLGKWDKAMNYYLIQPVKSSDEHLIESFKMNQFYGLCSSLSVEPEYECLWRLGHWKTNKKNALKYEEISPDKYEKYKFHSIKALCENDQYTCSKSKEQLSLCVIDNLKNISLESSKNIYPIMAQLQSLVEMDDFIEAVDKENFAGMFQKWRKQDAIIKRNDFNFIEPVIAQRITILRECVKKYPQIREQFFEMVLNFADYAKEEHHIKIAESAIINIRNLANVHSDMKNELQFREAQLAWLDNEKMIAMQLLRKLCKEENITPRLKASVMKLQGEYMAETYSDRKTIVNSFTGSIRLLQNISNNLTPVDRRNLEDIYDKMATFADREYQQIMVHMKSDSFQKKVSNMKLSKEMAISIVSQKRKTVDERKAAVLHEKQCQIDQTEINTVRKDKDNVLCLAIKYYVKNLSLCDTNNIKIFRVMSLLLENRDNDCLARDIKQFLSDIPTYKYIMMLPQLIPHISMNNSDFFCDQINNIVEKCALDHPHHTLPLLLALINAYEDQKYDNSKTKKSSNDRIDTAKSMINKLLKAEKLTQMIRKMQTLSEALIELAYFSDRSDNEPNKAFNIPGKLKIHRIKDFDDILVPTCTLSVSKTNSYDKIVGIVKFMPTYKTVGGINAPKRIECLCTEGKSHSQLVKGKDDLRQDAVMQQVFKIMTDLLSSNMQTKNLLIRTYKIVPLSMRSGILKWVDNSMPIGNYLVGNKEENYIGAHSQFRPKDMRPNECRAKFKKCATCKTNDEKLTIYNDICKNFKPVFHKFFETYFPQPSVWYERRRAYIYSVATTSMCGYILGIGDRHVSNILIDKQTAEVIHIDFGIAFEQGKCLPTPETIPFRLTRDLVDGMGVSGVEGLFRKSCEKTVEVLRTNAQTILTTLEVLLYDPLYVWTLTSAEANKRQTEESVAHVADEQEEENKNVSAERALLRLKAKLQGTEEGKPTSIEQQVGTLIKQAMDPGNLCRLFCGWQPYL